ncbi:MAG: hypothetical protein GQ564_06515 [Bacteroidales bacterium]|nr:hypothetical protein [Bacteroidales bacterium]
MKVKNIVFSICLMLLSLTLFSQTIKELEQIESGTEFWNLYEKTFPLIEQDTIAVIKNFEDAFNQTNNSFSKASFMIELADLYISTKQLDKCLDMYENLINSGISVFFQLRGKTYPRFNDAFKSNERFNLLLNKNNELVEKANEKAKAEYYIQKPINYDANKKYPLLMVFHGGIGNIQDQQHFWKSSKLEEEYLVAFVQGRSFMYTLKRRFGNTGITDIKNIYKDIVNNYMIDTTNVILGGPSAGGMLSIDLAINNHLPAQGLILAYPVKPRAFGADEIYEAGLNGLRISMICGENDWAIKSQKEMSVLFDKLEVSNRIVVFSDYGHEYPDDFSNQILKSIEFIIREDK